MKIFITGASGYIGGSVAAALMAAGHQVSGLARSNGATAALARLGMTPVRGTLDDAEVLAKAAHDADVTVNAANAGHRAAAEAILLGLADTGKTFLHTDGSSIVGTRARGELVETVFDEDTPFTPTPQRAPLFILAYRLSLQKGCCNDFGRSENGIGNIKAGANAVDVLFRV